MPLGKMVWCGVVMETRYLLWTILATLHKEQKRVLTEEGLQVHFHIPHRCASAPRHKHFLLITKQNLSASTKAPRKQILTPLPQFQGKGQIRFPFPTLLTLDPQEKLLSQARDNH